VIPWRRPRPTSTHACVSFQKSFSIISNKEKTKARQEAMLNQIDVEMAARRDAVRLRLKIALIKIEVPLLVVVYVT
jgi:hypothetical protein